MKAPRVWSRGPWREGRAAKVTPSLVGVLGIPVPSVHASFCVQVMLNGPEVWGLKIGLPGGVAVSWSVTDWTTQAPAPIDVLKAAKAGAVSKRMRVWNSPRDRPGEATQSAPAPP